MVAVILLNWNGLAYTREAVASVQAQTLPGVLCVVADNGSSAPGEVDALRKMPGVLLVENQANLGFSGGNNRGAEAARAAGADLLLFLNNDATLAPDAAEKLVAALRADPGLGAVSPAIYHARGDGRDLWFGRGAAHLDHPAVVTLHAELPTPAPGRADAPTDWACGCALMMRTEAFFDLGGFDEGLFAYHEDVDLSLKVRASGQRCGVVPSASAWHVGGGGSAATGMSPRQLYYTTRNARVVVRRHGSVAEQSAFARRAAARLRLLTLALLARRENGDAAVARAAALRLGDADGRAGLGGPFEARGAEFEAEQARCWQRRRWLRPAAGALLPRPVRQRVDARLDAALGLPP